MNRTIQDFTQYFADLNPQQIDDVVNQQSQELGRLVTNLQLFGDDMSRATPDWRKAFCSLAQGLTRRASKIGKDLELIKTALPLQPLRDKQMYLWIIEKNGEALKQASTDFDKALQLAKDAGLIEPLVVLDFNPKEGAKIVWQDKEGQKQEVQAVISLEAKNNLKDLWRKGSALIKSVIILSQELSKFAESLTGVKSTTNG